MDMIGLNRQFHNLPAALSTLLLNECATVLGNRATKHGLAALGTPHQVVDDKVDAVFISLVFHVDIVAYNNISFYKYRLLERRLKPEKAPNCYRLNGAASGGLNSVSVGTQRVRAADGDDVRVAPGKAALARAGQASHDGVG
jgi:hypothetical protein